MDMLRYYPTEKQIESWVGRVNQVERDFLGGRANPYFALAVVESLERLKDEDPDLRAVRAAACAEQVGRSVEPLAEVYGFTGDERDLAVALHFLKRGDDPNAGLHIVDALGSRKRIEHADAFIKCHQWTSLALPWCRLCQHTKDRASQQQALREIENARNPLMRAEGAALMYERTGKQIYYDQLVRAFGQEQSAVDFTHVRYLNVAAMARRGRLAEARSSLGSAQDDWAKLAAYVIAAESLDVVDLNRANFDLKSSVPAPFGSNTYVHDMVLLKHVEHAVKSGDYKQARVFMDSMQDLGIITRAWCAIAGTRSCDCMNPMEHAQSRAEQMSSDRGSYGTERIGEAQCAIVETRLERLGVVDLCDAQNLKSIRDIAVTIEHTLWRCRAFLKIWQWRLRGGVAGQA